MKHILLPALLFLLAFTTACNPTGNTQASIDEHLDSEAETDGYRCPEETADTTLLEAPAYGFCLLYPADYQVVDGEDNITLVKDSLLNVSDPRLSITVSTAGEQTATDVADTIMADFPAEQWPDVQRSSMIMAEVDAEVINNLPGQNLNRRIVFVHEGLLYDLTFSPLNDADNSELEQLIQDITDSFQFMTVVAGAPLVAGPECPEETAVTQLVRSESNGYCLLIPADFTVEETSPESMVIYFSSMADTEHAKLFITVTEADGRPVNEIADELTVGLEAFNVQRTSGLLVDGEWAELISKVPGQELNRQLLFKHNGRLYTLTFTPDDATTGAAYEQMEGLYDLTRHSFNFLLTFR